jgi:hypothetical protein
MAGWGSCFPRFGLLPAISAANELDPGVSVRFCRGGANTLQQRGAHQKCAVPNGIGRRGGAALKFPVIGFKFPVRETIFPVNPSRELLEKWLQRRGVTICGRAHWRPKSRNSLLNSLITGNSHGDWFDQHCAASHAFRRFHRHPKRPENGPEIRAFRVSYSVSVLLVQRSQGRNLRKSPALSGNIPVLRRLSAETGLITTADRPLHSVSIKSPLPSSGFGILSSKLPRDLGTQVRPNLPALCTFKRAFRVVYFLNGYGRM